MDSLLPLPIQVDTRLHVDLFYHCCALLDLGADAASLFSADYAEGASRGRRALGLESPPVEWLDELARLIAPVPSPHLLTLAPLVVDSLPALRELLTEAHGARSVAPALDEVLQSAPARRFTSRLAALMDHERPLVEALEEASQQRVEQSVTGLRLFLAERCMPYLERLARVLPSMQVDAWLCLGLPAGGRAASREGRVTVALAMPAVPSEPFGTAFQLVHELTHLATDPKVLRDGLSPRQTREGTPGYATHQALERAAHRFDMDLFAEPSEEFRLKYIRWASRHGAYR